MKLGSRPMHALAVIAPCLLAVGCMAYAYPKVFYVPGCDAGPKVNGARAFRVDVTASLDGKGETGEYTVTEIETRDDGTIPTQTSLTLERGHYLVGISMNTSIGRFHTTLVRVYRPGYRLVELQSWDQSRPIQWHPAPDVDGQEKAIDDLLHRPLITALGVVNAKGNDAFWGPGNQFKERPGAIGSSPQDIKSLVFAAAEYRRVAAMAMDPADVARLREKANRLMETKPSLPPAPPPPPPPASAP